MNFFTPNQGVTSVSRTAVADALVVLSHAAGIDSTAIHARIFTVEIREAGLRDVAVFVFETFHLFAAFPLVVRVANVEAIWTCALGKVVVDNAHSSGCTFEELAAVLAPSLSIRFIKLADFIGVWTVSMINALWFWDLLATPSAVRVSGKTFSARTTAPVVERNAVCIGRTAEADANFSTLHYANSVGNAGRCCWAAGVVATLIVLSFNATKNILLVPNKAVSTLAFI